MNQFQPGSLSRAEPANIVEEPPAADAAIAKIYTALAPGWPGLTLRNADLTLLLREAEEMAKAMTERRS
jgi:hypothetical protein